VTDIFSVLRSGCPRWNTFPSAATTFAKPARRPVQELAFTLRTDEYVQLGVDAGWP
jgi:hypothetical protein